MIIVRIVGGIGNQMFQYAAGKSLAVRYNVPLKLDLSHFGFYKIRSFQLNKFLLNVEVASERELLEYKCNSNKKYKRVLLKINKRLSGIKYQIEPFFQYWDNFFKLGPKAYIEGYWQTEKYFKVIAPVIINEFTPDFKFSEQYLGLCNEIKTCNSVSIHVRRGDYVNDPTVNSVHGVCAVDYYTRAIEMMSSKVDNAVFYVFSDDLEFVKTNMFKEYNCRFVSLDHQNENRDIEEIMLMSNCKHNIIANSSFSWWGAWLNNHQSKVVIGPQKWFADSSIITKDILCESWISI